MWNILGLRGRKIYFKGVLVNKKRLRTAGLIYKELGGIGRTDTLAIQPLGMGIFVKSKAVQSVSYTSWCIFSELTNVNELN